MKALKQIRIIGKKDHQYYLKDYAEEPLRFQEYVNLELGLLFDEQHTIISITFLKKKRVVIVYAMKI
ncbi:hypothetical protein [Polaribacter glomeratus]|uniref:Uncharacterized protein n=1 Tax=Polaribacter glomeratus TaxID=102 RepID=A0A2S7WGS7_9FLAO|nr:hypothetical protein [Polaribacter glomeratus]PQJ76511.1 hypothetical protein BTO16_11440 [Polaribacter glomeratus]TXD64191.1 hypothetical protein ESX12_15885 [Polaribacter glomeratus]